MDKFKTIFEKEITAEIVEKKSKFIAHFYQVNTAEEAEDKIKQIKKKYYDARHNCSAYIVSIDGVCIKKSSDDGEPSGTAGAPMLEILEKQGLANVLVVVTRYFGGILLGTGGLVRAYSDALKLAIVKATIVEQECGFEISVELEYSDLESFKYYCKVNKIKIVDCSYFDYVICRIEMNSLCRANLEDDFNSENKLKIKRFDIIRQKNITVLSDNVD